MLILWQRMHVDMKSMLSWQYLTRDITQIRTWNITMVNAGHLQFFLFIIFKNNGERFIVIEIV